MDKAMRYQFSDSVSDMDILTKPPVPREFYPDAGEVEEGKEVPFQLCTKCNTKLMGSNNFKVCPFCGESLVFVEEQK